MNEPGAKPYKEEQTIIRLAYERDLAQKKHEDATRWCEFSKRHQKATERALVEASKLGIDLLRRARAAEYERDTAQAQAEEMVREARTRAEKAEATIHALEVERSETVLALLGRIDTPLPGKLPTAARAVVGQLSERAEKAEARVTEMSREREGLLMGGVTVEARQQIERAEKAEARAEKAEKSCAAMRAALKSTVEAVEASLPEGDEASGVPEFPGMKLSEIWSRRLSARALLGADDAGKDYVHRDALMRVAMWVFTRCCPSDSPPLDLAAIVKGVAP